MSNVQDMDEALVEDECTDEDAWYEAEDCENCIDDGIDVEWEWDCDQGAWRCLSCGNIQ